jgi:hypothetical protein
VVDTALAFDRSSRFPDARAMQRALREAAFSVGIPATRPAAAPSKVPLAAPTLASASDPRAGQSLDPETRRWSSGGGVTPPRSRRLLYALAGGLVAVIALGIIASQVLRPAPILVVAPTATETPVLAPATAPLVPVVTVASAAVATAPAIVSGTPATKPTSIAPRARASAAPITTADPLLDHRN